MLFRMSFSILYQRNLKRIHDLQIFCKGELKPSGEN